MQVLVGGMPGERAALDRRVAVAAVDAQLAGVMAVAERHRLLARDAGARDVRRAIDQRQPPRQGRDDEQRAEDAQPRERVGARVKNLGIGALVGARS